MSDELVIAEMAKELVEVEERVLPLVKGDFRIELVEGSSKSAREELTQGISKKQKLDDDKKIAELKQLMKIIFDKEEELDDFGEEYQVKGRIVRIKSHLNTVGITAVHIDVNAPAQILVTTTPRTVDLVDSLVFMLIDLDAPSKRSSSNVRPIHTPFKSLGRWTKDHPIANVISDPSRSVSTRKQLQTDAM
nr:hypothetical protein [Tanacetum cinerariifolium]